MEETPNVLFRNNDTGYWCLGKRCSPVKKTFFARVCVTEIECVGAMNFQCGGKHYVREEKVMDINECMKSKNSSSNFLAACFNNKPPGRRHATAVAEPYRDAFNFRAYTPVMAFIINSLVG